LDKIQLSAEEVVGMGAEDKERREHKEEEGREGREEGTEMAANTTVLNYIFYVKDSLDHFSY